MYCRSHRGPGDLAFTYFDDIDIRIRTIWGNLNPVDFLIGGRVIVVALSRKNGNRTMLLISEDVNDGLSLDQAHHSDQCYGHDSNQCNVVHEELYDRARFIAIAIAPIGSIATALIEFVWTFNCNRSALSGYLSRVISIALVPDFRSRRRRLTGPHSCTVGMDICVDASNLTAAEFKFRGGDVGGRLFPIRSCTELKPILGETVLKIDNHGTFFGRLGSTRKLASTVAGFSVVIFVLW